MLRNLLKVIGVNEVIPRTMPSSLVFLFKLAWQSKVRLPLLIAVVFMLTDYHLQLEIDVRFREEPNLHNNNANNNELRLQGAQIHIIEEDEFDENDEDWETASSGDEDGVTGDDDAANLELLNGAMFLLSER